MKYNDIRCSECKSYNYCKGKVSKGSSECDARRGLRSKKKSRRYSQIKEMLRR